ncbi:MAG: SAM-dependent methyltransferase [Erysipelotrichaceae bacterium]
MIYIIGLGAGDEAQLPKGMDALLHQGYPLYLRTAQHPVVAYLDQEGIAYQSFDAVYEAHADFKAVYAEIIAAIKAKGAHEDLVYAVPGHPCVAEYTVKMLAKEENVTIVGGQSFFDPIFAALKIDPIEGLQVVDALDFDYRKLVPSMHILIPQVFDQLVASEVKLDLMEVYDADHKVCIVSAAGSKQEKLTWVSLFELDHDFALDNLITVYVPPVQ